MTDYVDKRLNLTRCSIGVWETDVAYIDGAGTASAHSGYVDAHNLVRAGEVLKEIEAESRVLRHLANRQPIDHHRIDQLIQALEAIRSRLVTSSRRMHGMTARGRTEVELRERMEPTSPS